MHSFFSLPSQETEGISSSNPSQEAKEYAKGAVFGSRLYVHFTNLQEAVRGFEYTILIVAVLWFIRLL